MPWWTVFKAGSPQTTENAFIGDAGVFVALLNENFGCDGGPNDA